MAVDGADGVAANPPVRPTDRAETVASLAPASVTGRLLIRTVTACLVWL
jgi:hypothetical protein